MCEVIFRNFKNDTEFRHKFESKYSKHFKNDIIEGDYDPNILPFIIELMDYYQDKKGDINQLLMKQEGKEVWGRYEFLKNINDVFNQLQYNEISRIISKYLDDRMLGLDLTRQNDLLGIPLHER